MSDEQVPDSVDGTGNEQPTKLKDSNPSAGGPHRAAGGMGISSERVGYSGGGHHDATDGERDTTEPPHRDESGDLIGSDAEFEQGIEDNPEGLDPKAGYPAKDPRSKDLPYQGGSSG
jgi:hypothetical protein